MPRMNLFRLSLGALFAALVFVTPGMAADADLATLIADQQAAPAPQQPVPPALEQPVAPASAQAAAAPADEKGPPLPFHTIEGYGGGGITPFAYLVNPGKEECLWGKPAAALTFIDARQKDLEAVTASETLFGRLELSFGGDRLGLGTLPAAIKTTTGVGIEEDSVWLQKLQLPSPAVEGERLPVRNQSAGHHRRRQLQVQLGHLEHQPRVGQCPERHRLSPR